MNRRYSAFDVRNSTFYYRHDIMEWRRRLLGISVAEVARRVNIRVETVYQVFLGKATNKKAYPVCLALGLDWAQIHNLSLTERNFHLAIMGDDNGTSHSLGEDGAGTLVAEPAPYLLERTSLSPDKEVTST